LRQIAARERALCSRASQSDGSAVIGSFDVRQLRLMNTDIDVVFFD
jgi:hypothetical protein